MHLDGRPGAQIGQGGEAVVDRRQGRIHVDANGLPEHGETRRGNRGHRADHFGRDRRLRNPAQLVLVLQLHAEPHRVDACCRRLVGALVDQELCAGFIEALAVDDDAAEAADGADADRQRRAAAATADACHDLAAATAAGGEHGRQQGGDPSIH
ncbi:MAG: hypothetical protein MUD07_12500 [Burkholderiaceae bacterium]|nr:hypothetical protein [Burkholderiaceae bacterium]